MAFSNPGQPEMNVTPLIDVLLVLIIIFMIIVPMKQSGLDADLPRENTKETPDTVRTIVIQLHADGCPPRPGDGSASNCRASLSINEESVAWENLRARLIAIFKERAERVAFVKADSDLAFEQVADVIDIAHAAGVQNVGLMK